MSAYTQVAVTEIPFERGRVVQRHYDKLSVDFIVQNLVRSQVRATKIQRGQLLYPITRELTLPLTRRFNASEV